MVCSIVLYTKTCQNGKGHKPIDNFQGNVHILLYNQPFMRIFSVNS